MHDRACYFLLCQKLIHSINFLLKRSSFSQLMYILRNIITSSSHSALKVTHIGCLKVRGALETLVSALSPIDHAKGPANEVQPTLMNSDLLSREVDNISLLLNLLVSMLLLLFLLVLVV